MSQNGPFGMDPEEFDRVLRDAGDSLRDALDRLGKRASWATLLDEFTRSARPSAKPEPETTGSAGDGVWAVYTTAADGGAHIEEVYPAELDALRANKNNTDPARKVRFLPYGIAVSVLDEASEGKGEPNAPD
ncbi:hypothetical protein [Mycolicibacterium arenosum]|uniref:Transmembrane protein n=1 Tax=Mycolicibacterium arenosum TaxID=2952157 RepID=A0ABT1M8K9_9MYCO|nr:hypothetical protein [Mycolicibacterium sp. CAU 1645]MCP9275210.1 hypothetical protein [Mycolicibacterium sp. CAU 1645]